MSKVDYGQIILDSVETIVGQRLSSASFDKTIQATIISCEDESLGKYKIKYQDSLFYAYAEDSNATYSSNTNVYILVPGNDLSKEKRILGAVDKLGKNYVSIVQGTEESFDKIGTNLLDSAESTFSLCSYKTDDTKVLYDATEKSNFITINEISMEEYLGKNTSFIVAADFNTVLHKEQQHTGNYGIKVTLEFFNVSNNETKYKEYIIDIDDIVGQPYSLTIPARQSKIFHYSLKFSRIYKIEIFSKGFPVQAEGKPDDIFFSNFEFYAAAAIPSDELTNYHLSLEMVNSETYFQGHNQDSATIKAILKVNSKVVGESNPNLKFYWFIQELGIDIDSEYYNSLGGAGWKCLNKYDIQTNEYTEESDKVWEADASIYKTIVIKKEDVVAAQNVYKCVAVYEGASTSAEQIILNKDSEYSISIDSSGATAFNNDIGKTDLTCIVMQGEEVIEEDLEYKWGVVDLYGKLVLLPNMAEINKKLADAIIYVENAEYDMEHNLTTEADWPDLATSREIIALYQDTTRVDKNKIINLKAQDIEVRETYVCSVYKLIEKTEIRQETITNEDGTTSIIDKEITVIEKVYIGNSSVVITNGNESNGYSLALNNTSQVFKYSESGVSPASDSLGDKKLIIEPLKFTLFGPDGLELSDAEKAAADITWTVPLENTMLTVDTDAENVTIDDENKVIYVKGSIDLVYGIQRVFYNNRNNNTIRIDVIYNGNTLFGTTSFTFLKEGDPGTNGTEFAVSMQLAEFVDNPYVQRTDFPVTEIYRSVENNTVFCHPVNFDINGGYWLEFVFWHNGEPIFQGTNVNNIYQKDLFTTENKEITNLKWEILKNKTDNSYYTITEDGRIDVNYVDLLDNFFENPCNIIQVSFIYDKIEYFCCIPIVTVTQENLYNHIHAEIHDGGFTFVTYASDGTYPKYNNLLPFEFSVWTGEIYSSGGNRKKEQDITFGNEYKFNFDFGKKVIEKITGTKTVYDEETGYSWEEDITEVLTYTNLYEYNRSDDLKLNQIFIKPADSFNSINLGDALIFIFYKRQYQLDENNEHLLDEEGNEIYNLIPMITVHMPIHLSINRYGNAAINSWDGNKVSLNEDGDVLLAPQIGAGKKETDNSFTGLVMGEAQINNSFKDTKIGLMAYNHGIQTIFLDAQTGKAEFGVGQAAIILDPSDGRAEISGNYQGGDRDTGTGMLINLSEPSITWGNGLFQVNQKGILSAEEVSISGNIYCDRLEATTEGIIGGWDIGQKALRLIGDEYEKISTNYIDLNHEEIDEAGKKKTGKIYLGERGIAISNKLWFELDNGELHAKDIIIEGGSLKIGDVTIDASGFTNLGDYNAGTNSTVSAGVLQGEALSIVKEGSHSSLIPIFTINSSKVFTDLDFDGGQGNFTQLTIGQTSITSQNIATNTIDVEDLNVTGQFVFKGTSDGLQFPASSSSTTQAFGNLNLVGGAILFGGNNNIDKQNISIKGFANKINGTTQEDTEQLELKAYQGINLITVGNNNFIKSIASKFHYYNEENNEIALLDKDKLIVPALKIKEQPIILGTVHGARAVKVSELDSIKFVISDTTQNDNIIGVLEELDLIVGNYNINNITIRVNLSTNSSSIDEIYSLYADNAGDTNIEPNGFKVKRKSFLSEEDEINRQNTTVVLYYEITVLYNN